MSVSGSFQYTYYPKTFDWSSSDSYIAITGDSYSEGAGEAFLNDDPDYSIAHFLHQGSNLNFLIFGRSGYGSVSAARSVIENIRFSQLSPYFRDLEAPEEILFFFYEGNDLNNNLDFLKHNNILPGNDFDATLDQAIRDHRLRGYPDWKIAFRAFVPAVDLLSDLSRRAPILLGLKEEADQEEKEETRDTILSSPAGEFALPPLQTAAVELTEHELDRAIQVFAASINYLKTHLPEVPIQVVYLPSIVSVYDWKSDIRIQKYTHGPKVQTTAQENERMSREIRNRLVTLSKAQGWRLLDMTDILRTEANAVLVHGPTDWHHLNGQGYHLVAEELLHHLLPAHASR